MVGDKQASPIVMGIACKLCNMGMLTESSLWPRSTKCYSNGSVLLCCYPAAEAAESAANHVRSYFSFRATQAIIGPIPLTRRGVIFA